MALMLANQTRYGAEVQMTKAEWTAMVQALSVVPGGSVLIPRIVTATSNERNAAHIRIWLSTAQLRLLEQADGLT